MGGTLGTSASERDRKCDRAKRFRDGDGDKAIMTSFTGSDSGAVAVAVAPVAVAVAVVPDSPASPVSPTSPASPVPASVPSPRV